MATKTTLFDAIKSKSEKSITAMLQSGVDPNTTDKEGKSPLYRAVGNKASDSIISLLLQFGARPDYNILAEASAKYGVRVIEKLILHGAIPAVPPVRIPTVLHRICSQSDRVEICELLIKNGIDVDTENECYNTPLFYHMGQADLVDVFLHWGARPCYVHPRGTPLQHSFHHSKAIIEKVVKYAALQVNTEDGIELQAFFENFKKEYSRGDYMRSGRPYIKYAQDCFAEILFLKQLGIDEGSKKLFDFVSSRGCATNFCKDTGVLRRVHTYLKYSSIPIYGEIVMKKIDQDVLISKILESSFLSKLCPCGQRQKLNESSMLKIISYLSKQDIWNFYVGVSFL